jgi:hypothetical protein
MRKEGMLIQMHLLNMKSVVVITGMFTYSRNANASSFSIQKQNIENLEKIHNHFMYYKNYLVIYMQERGIHIQERNFAAGEIFFSRGD